MAELYSRPCPVLYQLRPFAHISHTIDERNPKIALQDSRDLRPSQAQGAEALMVERQVGQALSAVLDQGLRAYKVLPCEICQNYQVEEGEPLKIIPLL
jgi:hypothetical protein